MEKGLGCRLVEANEKCEFAIKIYSPLQTRHSKPQRRSDVYPRRGWQKGFESKQIVNHRSVLI